jgi:CubicO group peptidase (beta-lactamase class C family)
VAQLHAFLAGYALPREIGSHYEYSNLGAGLLGHVLARRARLSYEALVRARITGPLGMASTAITLTPGMQARLAAGHDAALQPAAYWDMPTLAGAGALRSTANDLIRFLAAELGYAESPLRTAMAAQLVPREPTGITGVDVALGWHITSNPSRQIIWHNGGTGGFRSFVGFDPAARLGVVVLANAATERGGDDIGMHLLTGAALRPSPAERTACPTLPKSVSPECVVGIPTASPLE